MNGMHGIIFSYEKKTGLRELIEQRIHGSIPLSLIHISEPTRH